jgi:hypothetical protein
VEPDRTTDTWSSSFDNKEEKLNFLGEYITLFSEVLDAEYHIVYHDNSNGLVIGPSDWDIRVVLKVALEDIELWTDGMKKLSPKQIDAELWNDLKSERFTWRKSESAEYWKCPDSNIYLVVYPESGILLKIVSTMYMSALAEIAYEDEVLGFDEYKVFAAELLGYDKSVIPYIMTRQAEIGLLASGLVSTVIVFEISIYGGAVFTPVMVIATGDSIICEVLIEGSYYSEFSIADIDGDSYDEILVHHCTGGNGGASSHETAVYKLKESRLQKLFVYPCCDDTGNRAESRLDTGFTLALADGWLHTIENKYTGYSLSFVREMTNENLYFDEHGDISAHAVEHNIDKWLGVDPFFFIFDPVDVNGDGIYEIMTAQYTYLWDRADGVGVAYTTLKWNTASDTMDVVKTGFWPYVDDCDNNDDYHERWQNYEYNWYNEVLLQNALQILFGFFIHVDFRCGRFRVLVGGVKCLLTFTFFLRLKRL